MNYRSVFLVNALIAMLLGVGLLGMPGTVLTRFGVDGYAATRLVSQFFGTASLAIGLVLWFAKDVTDARLQKGMGAAMLVGALAGLIISLVGTTSGILRSNGWIAMLIYVLLGLAYGYLVFMKPRIQAV